MLALLILFSFCTGIAIYGFIRKDWFLFYLGYFLFSLAVIGSELSAFATDGKALNLANASLWGVQLLLTLPGKSTKTFFQKVHAVQIKVNLSLALINVYGAYIVNHTPEFNTVAVATITHTLLAILALVAIARFSREKEGPDS